FAEFAKVPPKIKFILNATRLLQILRVLPDGADVTLTVCEDNNVKVESGLSSFSLFALRERDFPSLPDLDGEQGFSIKQSVLKETINKIIHSVAVKDTRPALLGAYFTVTNGRLYAVSCDSYTLSKCSVACEIKDLCQKSFMNESIIVPGHALNELIRMLSDTDEEVSVYLGVRHAIFHIGGVIFFTRLIDCNYIDYERIIPKDQTIFMTVERERFLASLERAMLIAEEKLAGTGRSYVKLTIDGDSLLVSSTSANGKVYDEMPCQHEGEDMEIGFNCRFLINSVKAADSEHIVIALKGATQSILITPYEKSEDKDFFYMILPVRMNG
ncbi:MAG: DNA polymerase III subunit beta, partial [Clostridia bacterium]|nr:DNA polymerase III subunit beta [Clostridia bacterium]